MNEYELQRNVIIEASNALYDGIEMGRQLAAELRKRSGQRFWDESQQVEFAVARMVEAQRKASEMVR